MHVLKRLEEIRRMKGIPQRKVAEELKITQSSYNKIEKGHTELTLSKFIEICEILDVNAVEVLFPGYLAGNEKSPLETQFVLKYQDHLQELIDIRDELIKELRSKSESYKKMADDYKSMYDTGIREIRVLKKELASLEKKKK